MSLIFLATVGQRPSAVTMAFDLLSKHHEYSQVGFIVTDPQHRNIKPYYDSLVTSIQKDMPGHELVEHVVSDTTGRPLTDIQTGHDAEIYFRSVLSTLKYYRENGNNIHFLVAGGRKAMTTYATLAASMVFGMNDNVYTIISSEALIRERHKKVPVGRIDEVEIVSLPMLPSRLLPSILSQKSVNDVMELTDNSRERFLKDLTDAEKQLAETVYKNPHASYRNLGKLLDKSHRTIENQLGNIYTKMLPYYEIQNMHKKKSTLVDVMAGRL